jgi:hypothetical protein
MLIVHGNLGRIGPIWYPQATAYLFGKVSEAVQLKFVITDEPAQKALFNGGKHFYRAIPLLLWFVLNGAIVITFIVPHDRFKPVAHMDRVPIPFCQHIVSIVALIPSLC